MKKARIIYLALFVVLGMTAKAQEKQPLKLVVTTPLPGFSGDFDHFGLDLKGKRLFLTAEDHKTVEVFDLMSGTRLKSITGFGSPHAIVFLPETNNFIVTDGDDDFGAVELVSGKDYSIINKIKLPPGVDGAVFNPVDKNYYVEGGGEDPKGSTHLIHIIDTKTFKLVGNISLPGNHSEAMAISHDGKKMYVNLGGPKEVGGLADSGCRSSQFDGSGRAQSPAVHRHAQAGEVFRIQHRYWKSRGYSSLCGHER